MKVLLAGFPTDLDTCFHRSCEDAGIELTNVMVYRPNPYNEIPLEGKYVLISDPRIDDVLNQDYDLYIFRYPFWLDQQPKLQALIGKKPIVVLTTEQGPTREETMPTCEPFQIIGVNNRQEILRYKERFPNKKILYFPFGAVNFREDERQPNPKYKCDFVADGAPHYSCVCCNGLKRASLDVLVQPLLDYDVALYGHCTISPDEHSWQHMPGGEAHYRGVYLANEHPKVYNSAKAYLGITFNWRDGGFGVKLGRALSTGVPIIWHRTLGQELEGLEEGKHFFCSSSPDETREVAAYILSHEAEAKAVGECGRLWAVENWGYDKTLERLVREIHA